MLICPEEAAAKYSGKVRFVQGSQLDTFQKTHDHHNGTNWPRLLINLTASAKSWFSLVLVRKVWEMILEAWLTIFKCPFDKTYNQLCV